MGGSGGVLKGGHEGERKKAQPSPAAGQRPWTGDGGWREGGLGTDAEDKTGEGAPWALTVAPMNDRGGNGKVTGYTGLGLTFTTLSSAWGGTSEAQSLNQYIFVE